MMKQISTGDSNKKWAWLIVMILILVITQFFLVLKSYYMLESEKILGWMLKYFSIPCLVWALFILKKFNKVLFYAYPEKYSEEKLNKWNKFRNLLISYVLLIGMASFFTYDSIIQTSDWLGSSKYERFKQVLKKVEIIQHGGSSRRGLFGRRGSNTYRTSDIYLVYKGKEVLISSNKIWDVGDTLDLTLNTGGFWGILYAKRL